MLRILLIIIIAFFFRISAFGQKNEKVDTINLYLNKTKYSLKTYKLLLGLTKKNYTITLAKELSIQDSIAFDRYLPFYFKLFDAKNRLAAEGLLKQRNLVGNIIHYYKNGKIDRVETWTEIPTIDTCNINFGYSDGTFPMKIEVHKKYKAAVKKVITYKYIVTACNTKSTCFVKCIMKFNANGNVKRKRVRLIRNYKYLNLVVH